VVGEEEYFSEKKKPECGEGEKSPIVARKMENGSGGGEEYVVPSAFSIKKKTFTEPREKKGERIQKNIPARKKQKLIPSNRNGKEKKKVPL